MTFLAPFAVQDRRPEFAQQKRFEGPPTQPQPQKGDTWDRIQGGTTESGAPALENIDHLCWRHAGARESFPQPPPRQFNIEWGLSLQDEISHRHPRRRTTSPARARHCHNLGLPLSALA